MPQKNQLNKNYKIFNGERLISFDETLMYNTLLEENVFPVFSNSFFIETGKSCNIIYTKFSKERRKEYQIYTSIFEEEKKRKVVKYPANSYAKNQVIKMIDNRDILQEVFDKKEYHIAFCQSEKNGLTFEYIAGKTLASSIDEHILNKEADKVKADLQLLKQIFANVITQDPFVADDAFLNFFNNVVLPDDLKKSKTSFIDLNLDNIIIDDNDIINIIDYEWVLPFALPAEFLIFRSLFLDWGISTLSHEHQKEIYKYFGIDDNLYNTFLGMEICFQEQVMSQKNSLYNVFNNMGLNQYDLKTIDFKKLTYSPRLVNKDNGQLLAYRTQSNEEGEIGTDLNSQIKTVIFEPSQQSIFMRCPEIKAIKNGEELRVKNVMHNADFIDGSDLYFLNKPQFYIVNNEYERIVIHYVVYLWKPDLVKRMKEDREELIISKNELNTLKSSRLYKIYSAIKNDQKKQ